MLVHVCNNYISSKVHRNIVEGIASFNVRQKVLVPVRRMSDVGLNYFLDTRVQFIYKYYPDFIKFFPFFKVFYNSLIFFRHFRCTTPSDTKFHILAHTLWSDGVFAYLISLILKSKYSVVVRNTDINHFLPKLPHYKWLIRKVLLRSENIIFVNSVYQNRIAEFFPDLRKRFMNSPTIFNGLDRFWLDSVYFGSYCGRDSVCYIGSFNENKNIRNIYLSALKARSVNSRIKLVLIGGSEEEFLKYSGIDKRPEWVITPGKLNDKELIANYLRKSFVFSMPSFSETFGLVYLEALSQGCNLICSKGEGIDGVVTGEYITLVDPHDVDDITSAVLRYFGQDYPSQSADEVREFLSEFSWDRVAQRYLDTINY